MSNFLPDLANWALRGGNSNTGSNNNNSSTGSTNGNTDNTTSTTSAVGDRNDPNLSQQQQPMTPHELRAQRLARMEELSLQQHQQSSSNNNSDDTNMEEMDGIVVNETDTGTVVTKKTSVAAAAATETVVMTKSPPPSQNAQIKDINSDTDNDNNNKGIRSMKKAKNNDTGSTSNVQQQHERRQQLKKEQLLQHCLHIQLVSTGGGRSGGGSTVTTIPTTTTTSINSNIVIIDMGDVTSPPEISISTIAEIIALRLSMGPTTTTTTTATTTTNTQPSSQVIAYLGGAYNRTVQELRNLPSPTTTTTNDNNNQDIYDLLQEMKHQIVSYTTTCIVEPDVFPYMSQHIFLQMAHAIVSSICSTTTMTTASNSSSSSMDSTNITLGGPTNSFFTKIMDELQLHHHQQQQQQQQSSDGSPTTTIFTSGIHTIMEYYCSLLLPTDSILQTIHIQSPPNTTGSSSRHSNNNNNNNNATTTSITCTPTNIVTAISTMCLLHKGVAMAITEYDHFLLPPSLLSPTSESSAAVTTSTNPTTTTAANALTSSTIGTPPLFVTSANNSNLGSTPNVGSMNPLLQLLSGNIHHTGNQQRLRQQPWMMRSGVSIEMGTVLGLCLHYGLPRPPQSSNPAFPPTTETLRQSLHTIDSVTRTQRQQLLLHQNECFNLIMSFLKVKNPIVKGKIMTWFTDVLLVNFGASALRPDINKVSSPNLLCNVSMMLLKLCQPFLYQDDKQHLIDAQFLYHPSTPHHGVFVTTGENAIPRLGVSSDTDDDDNNHNDVITSDYKPKNEFIPFCFFFCTHALHISIVPALQMNENLVRRINYLHHEITNRNNGNMDAVQNDRRFAYLIAQQRSEDVAVFQDEYIDMILQFNNFTAKVIYDWMNGQDSNKIIMNIPEEFVSDICDIVLAIVTLKAKALLGQTFQSIFQLFVKLLSPEYASMVRNYNLRAQLGDVLHDVFLPRPAGSRHHRDVPASIAIDPMAGGQTYLLSDASAQETLAPSLLLLYGEVEHTGYFDKMSHRAKIASLIQYLWESSEHRPAFRRITQNKTSFIKFANGIMNETNTLIATVMQKLPEIREAQEKMKNTVDWNRLSEDEQSQVTSRLEDNERDVKSSLPLCNKTLQMFGYLNTDTDIRSLFLLPELCSRLVTMLLHVLTKLVGSKGLDLKVDNPEQYDFRPKEMLRDLCAIFALFASSTTFQEECAKSGCDPNLLRSAVRTCRRLHLLEGESMEALASLPDQVDASKQQVEQDEALLVNAPDEFLDEIMSTYMNDPVVLPSGHYVDRSTITQHLLNDPTDPFNREPLTIDQVHPAIELKERMRQWLMEQHELRNTGNK